MLNLFVLDQPVRPRISAEKLVPRVQSFKALKVVGNYYNYNYYHYNRDLLCAPYTNRTMAHYIVTT